MERKNQIRHIIKSTSIFGGVQFFQIFVSVVRNKFLAIFLGSYGIGLIGLSTSLISLLQSFFGLGLNMSGLREVSIIKDANENDKFEYKNSLIFHLIFISALISLIFISLNSEFLSIFVFGETKFQYWIIIIGVILFFNLIYTHFTMTFQVFSKISLISKASIYSSVIALFFSILIYYTLKFQGIILSILVTSIITFLVNFFYYDKLKIKFVRIPLKDVFIKGKAIILMGLGVMFSNLISTASTFLILIYLKSEGSVKEAGYYQAGIGITSQYTSLLFASMVSDFFPRLTKSVNKIKELNQVVNNQGMIMTLIVSPLVVFMIFFAPLIIKIFLSPEFNNISTFVRYYLIGIFLQAANYPLGLIAYAKGDNPIFISLGLIGNVSLVIFSILGFEVWGLDGVGYLFVVHSLICFVMVYMTVYKKYNFIIEKKFLQILFYNTIFICLQLLLSQYSGIIIFYILQGIVLIFNILFNLKIILKISEVRILDYIYYSSKN